jgi:hypothetical protein
LRIYGIDFPSEERFISKEMAGQTTTGIYFQAIFGVLKLAVYGEE